MFAYCKYGKHFALYVEFAKELGIRPFFGVDSCNGETILNVPYGQIILTPGRKLQVEADVHDAEKQNTALPPSSARDAED